MSFGTNFYLLYKGLNDNKYRPSFRPSQSFSGGSYLPDYPDSNYFDSHYSNNNYYGHNNNNYYGNNNNYNSDYYGSNMVGWSGNYGNNYGGNYGGGKSMKLNYALFFLLF